MTSAPAENSTHSGAPKGSCSNTHAAGSARASVLPADCGTRWRGAGLAEGELRCRADRLESPLEKLLAHGQPGPVGTARRHP